MANDIFVDNCAATTLSNPMGKPTQKFVEWLVGHGVLVVSQKLLVEYGRSCSERSGCINIAAIVNRLTATGRLVKFSPKQLDEFEITKAQQRRLKSNKADWVHIQTVALSSRRLAFSLDDNLVDDLNAFPSIRASASQDVEALAYS